MSGCGLHKLAIVLLLLHVCKAIMAMHTYMYIVYNYS